MNVCHNPNTPEFKALMQVYNNEDLVQVLINLYNESVDNTEIVIPTTLQVADMLLKQKKKFNAEKKSFAEKIMLNLQKLGYATKLKGKWIVKKQLSDLDSTNTLDLINQNAIVSYLTYLGFNPEIIKFNQNGPITEININSNGISYENINPIENNKHTISIINHFASVFPQIKIKTINASEAEVIYTKAAKLSDLKVDFANVKSFYANGTAYLINGRFSDKTAIEEIMHPFIDALYVDNNELFESLYNEAEVSYPSIVNDVTSAYNSAKNFDIKTRQLEVVTKALTEHINKRYEQATPVESFVDKVEEFFKWFASILNKLLSAITAGKLVVSPAEIESATNLSEIADMILTKNVSFNFNIVPEDLRLSIEPGLRPAIEKIKARANETQRKIIDDIVLNDPQKLILMKDIVVNGVKRKHIYLSESTDQIYTSTTTAIKGPMSAEDEERNALSLLLGNQVDAILEGIAAGSNYKTVLADIQKAKGVLNMERFIKQGKPMLQGISQSLLGEIYNTLNELVNNPEFISDDAVIIPQIIIGDPNSGIAGSLDLLVINSDGTLEIIDLKTSINSINRTETAPDGTLIYPYSDKKYPVKEGSLLGIDTELSTKAQQGIQVSTYRRILENMNYTVSNVKTIHILLKVDNGKVTGYEYEGSVEHLPTDNNYYVDKIVPSNESPGDRANNSFIRKKEFLSEEDKTALDQEVEVDNIKLLPILTDIKAKLFTRKQMVDRLYTEAKGFKNRVELINKLSLLITSMEEDINETQYNAALGKLLRYTQEDIQDFLKYLDNPSNFKSSNFATILLNYDKFLETYTGIEIAIDYANAGNQLTGMKVKELIREAKERLQQGYLDYAESFVKENSSNPDLTEDDIKEMLKSTVDEEFFDSSMSSLGAASDTLLQLINKVYKQKFVQAQYEADDFVKTVNDFANPLIEASLAKGIKPEDIYLFMFAKNPDGKFNGRYINRIGYQYWEQYYKLKEKTQGVNGEPLNYKLITNPEKQKADIEYNMQLYKDKKAFREFLSAEQDVDGMPTDGKYHKLTEEYKRERSKYQVYTQWGWKRKAGVDLLAYSLFNEKYNNKITFKKPVIGPDGMFTGEMKDVTYHAPKREYTEIKDFSSDGKDMRDQEYVKIMNPTDALGIARKNFYEFFIKEHQSGSLSMLPKDIYYQMMGKMPRISKNYFNKIKDMPDGRGKFLLNNIKDFIFKKSKVYARTAIENEDGTLVQGPPIFYTADLKSQFRIDRLKKQIEELNEKRKNKSINLKEYLAEKEKLSRMLKAEESKLTADDINTDVAQNMILFRNMANNYQKMHQIEDTIMVIQKIIEDREYAPVDSLGSKIKTSVGLTKPYAIKGGSNVEKRLKKWLEMVFRNESAFEEGVLQQYVNTILNYTSLTYVGFNVFSSLNNLIMGKINNGIESAGGQFYNRKAIMRSTKELDTDALPGFMRQLAKEAPGKISSAFGKKGVRTITKSESKYEAMVDYFKIIRGMQSTEGRPNVLGFAYWMQEGGEYMVQSKTGVARLMTIQLLNKKTGETTSIYDAFNFDPSTGELKLKDGYELSDKDRADITNGIWRMNEMIHGNYAYEDRIAIQNHWLGMLALQFHKWVWPALKIRFGKGRYDEATQTWIEGRYNTIWNFIKYMYSAQGNVIDKFKEAKGELRSEQIANLYKILAEIGFFLASVAMYQIFEALKDGTDDDEKELRRLLGALQYQGSKQQKELLTFVSPEEYVRVVTNPIASSRSLREFAEALGFTVDYFNPLVPEEEKYYQRTERKGEPKYYKQWGDVAPILYEINRWKSYDTVEDFYVR